MAEPNTVVPTSAISTDSSFVRPTSRFRKTSRRISSTMKEVPDTGSMPVSPITLTAIAPSRKVVERSTTENIREGSTGYPPMTKIRVIEKNDRTMNIGMW